MSCALILWIILIDAVLLRCFGLYGSQDRKNGVTWYFGTWMRLRIESYVHAAKCQSLRLVSLNQLQTRGLELVKVLSFFFMATQTCNISMVGNIYGLLMVLRRNEKSWCVSCLVRISGRINIGFFPMMFGFWCHGLKMDWKIEICINNTHIINRKIMKLLAYFLWSCFTAPSKNRMPVVGIDEDPVINRNGLWILCQQRAALLSLCACTIRLLLFCIMAFTGLKLYGEVELATMSILGVGQRLIIFFLKASAMMGILKVWWLIVLWWWRFQGIIKPKLASSWEFIYIFK